MNGYWYSNTTLPEATYLEFVKRRGNGFYNTTENNLGFFGYTNDLQQTNQGCLVYSGQIDNSLDALDENLDNNINIIKNINTQYSLVYVTDQHIIFCTDQFATKQLWFYYSSSEKQFSASTSRSVVLDTCKGSWMAEENKIYVIDRNTFQLKIIQNTQWNLEQTVNNYDRVFEAFDQAVLRRVNTNNAHFTLSAGFDTGVVCASAEKQFNAIHTVTKLGLENKDILFQRCKLHKSRVFNTVCNEAQTVTNSIFEDLPYSMITSPTADSLVTIVKQHVLDKRKHVLILGIGGDQLYSDYMHPAEKGKLTKNCVWPDELQLVFPYHNFYTANVLRQVIRADAVCAYFGVDARMPLLDKDLYQAWLNTTCDLKNSSYKDWMRQYLKIHSYPFNDEKTGMST